MASDRLSQLTQHLGADLTGPLLKGQVAIVTGSGQGIGKNAALLFAQHGAKVVVSDLDGKKADEVAKLITDAGGEALAVAGNVMDAEFGEKIVKATIDKFGKINHIVK
jgi:3-oxoacyl-[acyl-carrier protein] reductase